jgi:hypothetical protein
MEAVAQAYTYMGGLLHTFTRNIFGLYVRNLYFCQSSQTAELLLHHIFIQYPVRDDTSVMLPFRAYRTWNDI